MLKRIEISSRIETIVKIAMIPLLALTEQLKEVI